MTNAVLHYDFTLYDVGDRLTIIDQLNKWCRKWVFQLERGELNGRLHFQGRFMLKEKMRKDTLLNKWVDTPLHRATILPTTNANKDNEYYQTKIETRVKGPWSDRDQCLFVEPYIRELQLSVWQSNMVQKVCVADRRAIHVLFDMGGHTGKSDLCRWLEAFRGAVLLEPTLKEPRDIMRMVMNTRTAPPSEIVTYVFDLPRAMDKSRMTNLWLTIETIKNGSAYDDRYSFRRIRFMPPNILVMTNKLPDMSELSADRWHIWVIQGDQLVPFRK